MDEYDVVLFTLGQELSAIYGRQVDSLATRLGDLAEQEDLETLREEIETLDLYPIYEENRPTILHYNTMAFLYGVHQVSDPSNSRSYIAGVTPNIVSAATDQVGVMLAGSTETLKSQLIAQVEKLEEELVNEADQGQKAEVSPKQRILLQYKDNLKNTAKSNGQGLVDLVSSLNTSRLVSYGFLNECALVGITHYRYKTVNDSRRSQICTYLDGMIFPVAPNLTRLDTELRINDSTEMKNFSKWFQPNPTSIAELTNMSTAQITESGWAYPPNHPHCRSILEYVTGRIQVAGLDIPTAPQGLKEILSPTEIRAILQTVGLTNSTVNLAKGALAAGASAFEVMSTLAISAEALSLVQAALDFDLL